MATIAADFALVMRAHPQSQLVTTKRELRALILATAIANINTGKSYSVRKVKKMDKKNLLTLVGFEGGRGDKGGQAPRMDRFFT